MKDLTKIYEYEDKMMIKYGKRWSSLITKKETQEFEKIMEDLPEKKIQKSSLMSESSRKAIQDLKDNKDELSVEESKHFHKKVTIYD